jgi:hypothetical protein
LELEIRVGRGTEKNKDVGLDKHIHATAATSITTAASANTITDADDIAAAAKDNTVTNEQPPSSDLEPIPKTADKHIA